MPRAVVALVVLVSCHTSALAGKHHSGCPTVPRAPIVESVAIRQVARPRDDQDRQRSAQSDLEKRIEALEQNVDRMLKMIELQTQAILQLQNQMKTRSSQDDNAPPPPPR